MTWGFCCPGHGASHGLGAATSGPLGNPVSGEYTTLSHVDTATGKRDVRRLVELFTMLKRAGAEAGITYAALDIARYLSD
ncbi:hypothetical protein [Streptomyces luteogriseus]|uniref:hypothetical protein n=1 Tax=Streptomyces luteogriseus TaxID=68233 RepID=UPI0038108B4C